jgi:predicted Zn-dependent peptidase
MEKTGFIGVHASLDEKNIDKAVKLAKEVLASVKTEITDEELEKAKNTILYTMASNYDSCACLASAKGSCTLFGIEIKTYEQIRDALKEITKEDLFEFAQKYIPDVDEDRYSLTVMTPYESLVEKD